MRLQIAIDRVDVKRAEEIIRLTEGCAGIIEIGTSLIKDFGLAGSVGLLRETFPNQCLLADIKTCDEGAYEFRKCYEAGADIAVVMGFSSPATIRACRDVAVEYDREYMIDLMEVSDAKLALLKREFPEAIFGVHLPSDNQGQGLAELLLHMCRQMRGIRKISVAVGVTLDTVYAMKKAGVDTVIVGSAIIGAADVTEAVPVIRLEDARDATPLALALCEGGLPCAEVTFRTGAAAQAIRTMREAFPKMLVGAGTVLSTDQVDAAMDAGAAFIVSPGLNPRVVKYCLQREIPILPGVATASEIETALELGLRTVKFFPAEANGGIRAIRALAAPYTQLRFLPTGGVNPENVPEYLAFDRVVACGGSWMAGEALIKSRAFDKIRALTVEAVQL